MAMIVSCKIRSGWFWAAVTRANRPGFPSRRWLGPGGRVRGWIWLALTYLKVVANRFPVDVQLECDPSLRPASFVKCPNCVDYSHLELIRHTVAP